MIATRSLFHRIIDDAAMFPPGNAPAPEAIARHLEYRRSWFADLVGPLVVADHRLSEVGREARRLNQTTQPIGVSVVNTTGAGGLLSLANRQADGLQIVAVESALRDLDDLPTNAQRVVSAAEALAEEITVFVELPYSHGWERAVEVIEAAELKGKIRTGGVDSATYPTPGQLADQLHVLVEADLPFKATAGLHRAWANEGRSSGGETLPEHGFVNLLIALQALIEGASVDDAAALLTYTNHDHLSETIKGWDEITIARVRRRMLSFGCCGVTDPVDDLVALNLVIKE